MSDRKEKQLMMTMEEAQKIWKGSDMSDEELVEWVRLVNQRVTPEEEEKNFHKGETIEIS